MKQNIQFVFLAICLRIHLVYQHTFDIHYETNTLFTFIYLCKLHRRRSFSYCLLRCFGSIDIITAYEMYWSAISRVETRDFELCEKCWSIVFFDHCCHLQTPIFAYFALFIRSNCCWCRTITGIYIELSANLCAEKCVQTDAIMSARSLFFFWLRVIHLFAFSSLCRPTNSFIFFFSSTKQKSKQFFVVEFFWKFISCRVILFSCAQMCNIEKFSDAKSTLSTEKIFQQSQFHLANSWVTRVTRKLCAMANKNFHNLKLSRTHFQQQKWHIKSDE